MASHSVLKEQLLEMGFEEKLIQGALSVLKDKATLEAVIESIENGTAEVEATKLEQQPPSEAASDTSTTKETTPEEFEARKKAIEERIKQRRLELEEKEKEEERIREIKRRQDGAKMGKMKEEIEKIQRQKVADEIKREKDEAKAARDAIIRKIEQDKAERRAKTAPAAVPTTLSTTNSPSPSISLANVPKDGKTKLAIRLLDGSSVIQDFDSKEILSSVRAYIVTQKNISYNITFAMPPKQAFGEEDMEKPLHALGLCPNARLQVVKRN